MVGQKFIFFLVVLFCCLGPLSFSQVKSPAFKFNKIDKPLKQNGVTCIIQDNYGYLWVGTVGGLHRFDGLEYEIYESSTEPTSLYHSEVRSMLQGTDGKLWMGSIKGLCLYNRQKNNFILYELKNPKTNEFDKRNPEITSIVEDGSGTVWVSNLREGLFYKSKGSDRFELYDDEVLQTKNITSLYLQNDTILWIGTSDEGLAQLNLKQRRVRQFKRDGKNKHALSLSTINTMVVDQDQNLFVGGSFGINRLAHNDSIFHRYSIQKSNFYKLFIDSKDRLWAAGVNSGMYLYDRGLDEFILFEKDPTDPTSIPSHTFWDVYEDKENRIWLGSTLDGLIVIDNYLSQFDLYDKEGSSPYELSNHNIRYLLEDEKENLWIATDGGGLNYFDRETSRYSKLRHDPSNPHSLGADAALTICKDHTGNLWVGTWEGGVSIVNPETLKVTPFEKQNPDFLKVLHIMKASNDVLWFATIDGGVSSYNITDNQLITYKHDVANANSINDNRVRYIFEDSHQNIWIGTSGSGLDLLKKADVADGNFTHLGYDLTDSTKLPAAKVNHIMEDRNSNIWVATESGLSRYVDSTSTFITYRFGEQHFQAAAVAEDDHGFLWISTSPGIIKFDPRQNTYRKYGKEDGVQAGEFSRYCVAKTRRGEIAFGGEHGFTMFYPNSIKDNKHQPEVYITDLKVFNKTVEIDGRDGILQSDISLLDEITLSHKQSVFTLEYNAINYTSAERNSYAYKLVGLEEDWNYVGNRRTTTYTNLDPGEYVFHVKAANNHGVWNEEGKSLTIRVLPPWWLTWWAITLWTVLFLGSFVAFYKFRVASLKRQRQKLQTLVAERTEDLNRQSQELQKTNEELKAYDHTVSHDLKGPIGNVHSLVQLLIKNESAKISKDGREIMNYLLNSSTTAKELIDELLSFASADKPEALEKQVDMEKQVYKAISAHSVTINAMEAFVDAESVDIAVPGVSIKIYQLFYNLIGNALKFQDSERKPIVKIYSRKKAGKTEIVVEDNGIGFDTSEGRDIFQPFSRSANGSKYAGYGIGLGTCQRIVDYHGWTIRAESVVGQGSKFIIGL